LYKYHFSKCVKETDEIQEQKRPFSFIYSL